MADNPDIDAHTGIETTGHDWDGIKELNKPLPKWWVYVLHYSQRATVNASLADARAGQAKFNDAIAKESLAQIKSDPDLLSFALAGGRSAFANNCAACHGRGAQGSPGYPNLNDDNWIWGGTLDQIQQTILASARCRVSGWIIC
jgi:cytochrome c oxidase cbb3-type subunit 3